MQGHRACHKASVSELLRLNGKVTGRAIAYATVLVGFLLAQVIASHT